MANSCTGSWFWRFLKNNVKVYYSKYQTEKIIWELQALLICSINGEELTMDM